jgi:predicted phosphodiesterase
MRIAITSDIHIDKNGQEVLELLARRVRELAPDVLVVAGDIATGPTTFLQSLLALRDVAPEVVVVAGNHDVWSGPTAVAAGITAWTKLDTLLPALCAEAKVHCLDAGAVQLGEFAFCGSLGWYDLSMIDPDLGAPAEAYAAGRFGGLQWMDHVYAVFPDDVGGRLGPPAVAKRLADRLRAQLAAVSASRIVGVTHMLPFDAQLHRKPDPGWRFMQAFIGHRALGEILSADSRVELAIAGHTHHASDMRIGSLHAVVSPLGYRSEWMGRPPVEAVERAVKVVDL